MTIDVGSSKSSIQDLPKYKIIKGSDSVIIFFPHSLDIISMDPIDFKQTTEKKILECHKEFLDKYKMWHQGQSNQSYGRNEKPLLSKLMLNVSDRCGLDCTYCYAAKYYQEKEMSIETIEKVILKFFLSDMVAGVNRVVFFGGEPLINLPGIEYFIRRMEELFAAGKIIKIPKFNIITNGTIYSERIERLFKKYDMGIIVSCDGPPELQNKQRPFRDSNKGSYETVSRNIKQMVNAGLELSIECTITNNAMKKGYDMPRLKKFFHEEFGITSIYYVPELRTEPEKIFNYEDFHKQSNLYFHVLKELNSKTEAFEVPHRLLTRNPLSETCGMARTMFHITADGNVYPCQLIAGMEEFKIDHIEYFNDSYFISNVWTKKFEKHSSKCQSCWAKPLCKFCPAREILESGSYTLSETKCKRKRELIQDLIEKVTIMRKDPQQWKEFTHRLKEKTRGIDQDMSTRFVID